MGPHWKLTTSDGTQYFFGRQRLPGWTAGGRETQSVLGQQVWANHSDEPCFTSSSFYDSHCWTPYRWNLDYVLDVHGNSMSYWYQRFTNLHGSNGNGWNEKAYDRDAVLTRIEYGTRAGNETTTTPPAVIEFTNADRCLAADCNPNVNWPDTPWDLQCTGPPCQSTDYYGNAQPITGPTYWTSKRLAKVTTKVWTGSGSVYKLVDEWSFAHQFPGGTDVPVLWLSWIFRKGFDSAGNSLEMPGMTFGGRKDRNRADYDPNASMADPQKYRIDKINTETGGRIEVSYLPTNEPACTWWSGKSQSEWPNYNHNASRCFMQYITNRSGQSAWSWWHKFVVDKVYEKDLVGGSPDVVTSYQYSMDGAGSPSGHPLVLWSYASNPWSTIKKAMSTWRGYPTVTTTVGAAGGVQSKTKRLYYRGLDRDTGLDPNQNFFRRATLTASTGITVDDHQAMAGEVREEIVYDGATEISKTVTHLSSWQTGGGGLPSWQTPPERIAYMTREALAKTFTKVIADGSWRITETASSYDLTYGSVLSVDDKGDVATGGDDVCTRHEYVRNTNDVWLRAGTGGGMLASGIGSSIASDWSGYDLPFSPGDFTGDSKPDVIARSILDGNAYLFPGNGTGGFGARSQVGWGWSGMDQAFSPGDWDGDGKPDLIYRRTSDNGLYLVRGNGAGGWVDGGSIQIGWGWGDIDRILSVGDFSGNGTPDVIFRRTPGGDLYYFEGTGTGWFTGSQVQIAAGSWNDRDVIFGKGDVTGDGKADLYARSTATGELKLYPGGGGGAIGTPLTVGGGFGGYTHLLATGDMTSDGKPDVLARLGGARLTETVRRVETVGVNCATTPTYPGDVLADVRTFYDEGAYGAPPMRGLATRTETVKSMNGATVTGFVVTTAGYDQYGRGLWAKDALNRQTSTAYTHDTAGLLISVRATNPGSHQSTTTVDTLRGSPLTVTDANGKVTTGAYDPLGRLVKVWQPGHPTSGTPDVEYTYSISQAAPSYVATKALGPNGNQIVSYEIVDGLLRPRQTQTPTQDGKRAIADVQYDGRALAVKTSTFFNNASAPSSTLVTFNDVDVASQTRAVFDGAGRPTHNQLFKNNVLQWQSETRYGGDRVGVIPPTGGTAVQDLVDARGRVSEKRLFSGTPFSGAFDKTSYRYDDAGRLTGMTDPAGNQWTYTYDLLGRKIQTIDPDAGISTSAYDDAGQISETVDGNNNKLIYKYDNLGRRTELRQDSATGTLRASWTYDTLVKGQLSSTSRFEGGLEYKQSVGSYDDGYRPLSTTTTVPGFGAGGGTLTYTVNNTYKPNGALATQTLPAVGGLPSETLSYAYVQATGLPERLTTSDSQGVYVNSTTYHYDGLVYRQRLGQSGKQVSIDSTFDPSTRRADITWVETENPSTPGSFTTRLETGYHYDPAGNLTAIHGKTDSQPDQQECFRYDHLRRLTEAWTQTSGACTTAQRTGADPYWRKWTFDKLGNRLTQTDKDPAGDTTWTSTVGAAGSVKPHQVKKIDATGPKAGTATRSFGYDAGGNTTSRTTASGGSQTLTWDKEGHLATLTDGGVTTSYTYDTAGNRLISSNANKKILFLPDGSQLEKIGTADPLGTRYYSGVAVRDNTGLRWTIADHNGTGVAQIDPATLAVSRKRSMPYGEDRTATPSGWKGDKGYVGGTKDDTALVHLSAREYDPTSGRFISVDPIFDHSDPQQWHGYSYSNNNPSTWSDPSGLLGSASCEGGHLGGPGACTGGENGTAPSNMGGYEASLTTLPNGTVVYQTKGKLYINSLDVTDGFRNEDGTRRDDAPSFLWFANRVDQYYGQHPPGPDKDIWDPHVTGSLITAAYQGGFIYGPKGTLWFTWALGQDDGMRASMAGAGMMPFNGFPGSPRRFGGANGSCHSFDPDTKVLLADGSSKEIEDIAIGDVVLATDPETGETGAKSVTAVHNNEDWDLTNLVVQNVETGETTIINTTWHHLFWDGSTKSWINAADLTRGTLLIGPDGTADVIVNKSSNVVGSAMMRDLTVADIHTYYVLAGNTPVLVHNCPDDVPFGNGGARPPKAQSYRSTTAGSFPTRDQAWNAANRDRANYRYARTREECAPGACHVHLDIYNNNGELLETRHYHYQR